MNDKVMLVLSSNNNLEEHACLYLERSPLGVVALINIFGNKQNANFRLIISLNDGFVHSENFSENYKLFKLNSSFNINSKIKAELYNDNTLIMSAIKESAYNDFSNTIYEKYLKSDEDYVVKIDDSLFDDYENYLSLDNYLDEIEDDYNYSVTKYAIETNQLPALNEAKEIINNVINKKLDDLDCINKTNNKVQVKTKTSVNFYDLIKEDFELLFNYGTKDYSLDSVFNNSIWSKLVFDDSVYLLGKINNDIINTSYTAIAIPVVKDKQTKNILGSEARFVSYKGSDEFGFMVLVQEPEFGNAVAF